MLRLGTTKPQLHLGNILFLLTVVSFSYGLQIANLLNCTSWSGVGPGLMHAATKGALEVGKPVGGLKIGKEADEGTASNFHLCLPSETYLTCR